MERWLTSRSQVFFFALCILITLSSLFILFKMTPYLHALFRFIQAVLGPFFIAMLISYLLNPIVNLLHRHSVPRSIAVVLIYVVFLGSLSVILMNTIPIFEKQMIELYERMPEWNQQIQHMIHEYSYQSRYLLPSSIHSGLEKSFLQLEKEITDAISRIVGGLENTLSVFFMVLTVPFLAFYMMKDAQSIERFLITLLPAKKRKGSIRLFRNIDEALGHYVRGQLLVALVVGALAYLGYTLIQLPYALLFAAVVSLFNIIPYVGPIFGAVPAIFIALTQSKEMVIWVIVVNLIVQLLEGNIISPQIVGRSLHMHPLVIIFSLLVGGYLGGIMGLILAVPLFVIGKVTCEHFQGNIQHSE